MSTQHASYIYSSYSFINTLPRDKILQAGDQTSEGATPIPSFDENLLINLCKDAQKLFESEKNVINIEGDVIVVGDIHGSLHDLFRIINYIEKNNVKALFLGDYVDRGTFSIECITLLFTLKLLKPHQYFLLRGNHEFDSLCSYYGFKTEILNYHNPQRPDNLSKKRNYKKKKFEDDLDDFETEEEEEEDQIELQETLCESFYANHVNSNCYKYTEKLYRSFIVAFSYMPICAIVNQNSICLHGGLSPLLTKVDDLNNNIKRPVYEFEDNILLSDVVWSDPSESLVSSFCENQRGHGKIFNGNVVVNFLKENKLIRLIRGHQCVQNGVMSLFNEKCITVFSASSYSGHSSNLSGILKIHRKSDKIEPITFPPISRLKKCDTSYYKVQSFDQSLQNKSMFSNNDKKITEYKSGFFSHLSCISANRSDLNIKSFISATNNDLLMMEDDCKKNMLNPSNVRKNKCLLTRKMPVLKSGPRKRIFGSSSLTSNASYKYKNPFSFHQKLAPLKDIDDDDENGN